MGVTRWSGGNDQILRTQMDDSHASLEAKAAIFTSGLLANRPAAGASNARGFYLATDQNVPQGKLYYSDGSSWTALNNFADPIGLVPGDTIAQGDSVDIARANHRHSLPSWGATNEVIAVGTTSSAGSVAKFAKIDHKHTIDDGGVTAGKIAAGGVSATNQIADGIITTSKIASSAVVEASISVDMRFRPGMMMMYAAATAPTGWLICDGAFLLTASYPALFGVLGYTYGGSGSTFRVPDMRGRSPLGVGQSSGLSMRALAYSAGEENHLLTAAEMPAHYHNVRVKTTDSSNTAGTDLTNGYTVSGPSTWMATDTQGGSATHNNMHPFLVVNFIIKI
jgi:microcystin-dependent protein